MNLPSFEYRLARTVDEALAFWEMQPGARYLAGGTDLLPQMRGRRKVDCVVDIKRIPELSRIRDAEEGGIAIGAAVCLGDVAADPRVRQRYPVLADCCLAVGAWPLRNRATLAGNVCNASPAADTAVALLALDAWVVVAGSRGRRTFPVAGFFQGPGSTALADGELVTEIQLPASSAGFVGSYLRLSRRRGMDLATVGVLVARAPESKGRRHRVALAAVAPTPLRVGDAEAILDKKGAGAAARAADVARAACRPITDVRGTADYRRDMVGVLVRRAVDALGQG